MSQWVQTGTGLTGAERELSAASLPALRNEDVSRGERNLWLCSCPCLFGRASGVRKQGARKSWEIGRGCERESNPSVVLPWRDWGKAGINETLLLGGASWVDSNPKSFLLFVPPLADLNEKQRTQRTRRKMRHEVYREQERRQWGKFGEVSGGILKWDVPPPPCPPPSVMFDL